MWYGEAVCWVSISKKQSGFAFCILNHCLKMWLRDGLSRIKMKLWGILPLLHPFPLAWPYVPLIPQGACMRSIRKLTMQKQIAFWQFSSLTWLTKGSDESQHVKRGRERMFRRETGEPGLAAASIEIVLNHCRAVLVNLLNSDLCWCLGNFILN